MLIPQRMLIRWGRQRRERVEMIYDLAPEEPERPKHKLPKLPGDPPEPPPNEIEDDLHCVQCGYNLRGLTRKHRCPECGTPARLSIAGVLLQYAPAGWLKKVKNGLAMMLWSIVVDLSGLITVFFMPKPGYLLALLSAGLAIAGVFYLTTLEPRASLVERVYNLRRWLRQVAVLRFACSIMIISSTVGSISAKIVAAALLISGAASIAVLFGVSFYLRTFSLRMQDYDLERSTNNVIWGLTISLGVLVVFSSLSAIITSPRILGPTPCIAWIALISAVWFACWFVILLSRYYTAIKWAAHLSELQNGPPLTREQD